MNKVQRTKLFSVNDQLYKLRTQVEDVLTVEQDKRDNMADRFQFTQQYEDIDAACAALEDALLSLDDAMELVDNAAV